MVYNGYELTGYSDTFLTPYQSNGATFYLYKSSRKNSISESFSIMHLIGNTHGDRKISDKSIMAQFVGSVEKMYYILDLFDRYHRGIHAAAHCTYFKPVVRKCVNGYYGKTNDCYRTFEKHKVYSFEQLINMLIDVYNTVYPYNTIDKASVHENSSVRYYINKWYRRDEE